MAKCLVTGGAGFIGSHVTDRLIKNGHRVVILDDLSGGFIENVNPTSIFTPNHSTFVQGSILDVKLIEHLFKLHHFDVVYHLAAYAAENLSPHIPRFNYQNNLIGSVNLINASVNYGVERFIFASSIAVYGDQEPPFDERIPPQPNDPYGIAKLTVEQHLRVCKERFGLDYVIFRPHNVYGERQNLADPYRNVVGIFCNQIMRGQPLTVFGDGSQTRAFSYIGDVVPILSLAAVTSGISGQTFNIGSDTPVTVKTLAEAVCAAFNVPANIQYLEARHEVQHAYANHAKVRRYFYPHPETPLSEGLARMAAWAKQHGARAGKPFKEIEISAGLPDVWRVNFEKV